MPTLPLIIPHRQFFPSDFRIDKLEQLTPFLDRLLQADINSIPALTTFLLNLSEAEAIIGEAACWIQINATCDTENAEYKKAYDYFYTTLQPYLQVFSNDINKKIIACEFAEQLPKDYFVYLRNIKKNISLFKQENVSIHADLSLLQQEYGIVCSKMSVLVNDKEITLQQAASLLKEKDRTLRKDVYFKIQQRRLQDKDTLNELFSSLVEKRHAIATNAGFENYTSYKFQELGRFEYGQQECFDFHHGIQKHILPLVTKLYENKKQKLCFQDLFPWDINAPAENEQPLKPFSQNEELFQKTLTCLHAINPFFAACLSEMKTQQRLDTESRKGKAPGGYNCPLPESGVPFIFMNAAGTLDDVITLVHESGHAVHSFLSHPLPITGFKEYPMEIAELASMSMELFSLEHWHNFFPNPQDLQRAQLQQWERVLTIFPWIAIIDKFQHWIYANPKHSIQEREAAWQQIATEFRSNAINDTQTQQFLPSSWQKQLHLFEVPFYYIEYGIAQLGAISIYKAYKKDKQKCLSQYQQALALGGKVSLKELYETAGIELHFDEAYILDLMQFVTQEIENIEARFG